MHVFWNVAICLTQFAVLQADGEEAPLVRAGVFETWQPEVVWRRHGFETMPVGHYMKSMAVRGDYAFVVTTDSLWVVNISNKTSPVLAGVLNDVFSKDVVVVNDDYIIIISRCFSLTVVNVSDKARPVLAGGMRISQGATVCDIWRVTNLAVSGNYVFFMGSVVDVSDAAEPKLAGTVRGSAAFGEYTWPVVFTDDWAFGLLRGGGRIQIVNVSNKLDPELAGVWEPPISMYGARACEVFGQAIAATGDYVFVATIAKYPDTYRYSWCGCSDWMTPCGFTYKEYLMVVDVSDKENPGLAGLYQWEDPGDDIPTVAWGIQSIAVRSDHVYALRSLRPASELAVVDISNKANPVLARVLKGDPHMTSDSNAVAIDGHYAFLASDLSGALLVADVSDKTNPVMVGYLQLFGNARYYKVSVAASGDYVFVACPVACAVSVIDVSDKANPVLVGVLKDEAIFGCNQGCYDCDWFCAFGSYGHICPTSGIATSGDYVVVASGNAKTLSVLNVSDKMNPALRGALVDRQNLVGAHAVAVISDWAFVLGGSSCKLSVVDISDKSKPVLAGVLRHWNCDGSFNSMVVSGDYVFIVCEKCELRNGVYGQLLVVDVSDKSNPVQKGSYSESLLIGQNRLRWPTSVAISGNYAFVRHFGGVVVLDVTDTYRIASVARSPEPENIHHPIVSLIVSGDHLFALCDDVFPLRIVDISDKTNPAVIGVLRNSLHGAAQVDISGDYAVVLSDYEQSLSVVDVSSFHITFTTSTTRSRTTSMTSMTSTTSTTSISITTNRATSAAFSQTTTSIRASTTTEAGPRTGIAVAMTTTLVRTTNATSTSTTAPRTKTIASLAQASEATLLVRLAMFQLLLS